MKNQALTLILTLMGLTYSQSAAAYLDPGAGSLMLQMLVAGVLGGLYTIKLYWYRLKAYVDQLFGREIEGSPNTPDDVLPNTDDNK